MIRISCHFDAEFYRYPEIHLLGRFMGGSIGHREERVKVGLGLDDQ